MNLFIRAFLLLGGVGLLTLFPSTVKVSTQSSERVIEKRHSDSQPVELIEIKNRKGEFSKEGKIEDDDDWMGGLTVRVKNTSAKAVTYIQVELFFPPAENLSDVTEPPLAYFLYFGTRDKPDGTSTRPSLQPGEVTELTLSDERYSVLKRVLSEMNYSRSIRKVRMSLKVVIYDDDLMWASGNILRRDPDNPNKWVTIRPSQFAMPRQKKILTP